MTGVVFAVVVMIHMSLRRALSQPKGDEAISGIEEEGCAREFFCYYLCSGEFSGKQVETTTGKVNAFLDWRNDEV